MLLQRLLSCTFTNADGSLVPVSVHVQLLSSDGVTLEEDGEEGLQNVLGHVNGSFIQLGLRKQLLEELVAHGALRGHLHGGSEGSISAYVGIAAHNALHGVRSDRGAY